MTNIAINFLYQYSIHPILSQLWVGGGGLEHCPFILFVVLFDVWIVSSNQFLYWAVCSNFWNLNFAISCYNTFSTVFALVFCVILLTHCFCVLPIHSGVIMIYIFTIFSMKHVLFHRVKKIFFQHFTELIVDLFTEIELGGSKPLH